jgi:hypothetical protein
MERAADFAIASDALTSQRVHVDARRDPSERSGAGRGVGRRDRTATACVAIERRPSPDELFDREALPRPEHIRRRVRRLRAQAAAGR